MKRIELFVFFNAKKGRKNTVMKNEKKFLQVKTILSATPEELQEELNKELENLGTQIYSVEIITMLLHLDMFGAYVTYWEYG